MSFPSLKQSLICLIHDHGILRDINSCGQRSSWESDVFLPALHKFGSGSRLGFELTLSCRRHFFSRRINYHCNPTAFFQLDNLALCGDVHPNPGHGNTSDKAGAFAGSIPRGNTHYKPVRLNQKGILCDGCCNWHHAKCIGLDSREYMMLSSSDDSWYCANSFFPFNFTDSTDRLTEHATGSDLQVSLSSERVITDVRN